MNRKKNSGDSTETGRKLKEQQYRNQCQSWGHDRTDTGIKTNFRYKDTIFRMLFKEKANLLDLYNAVSGKHHTDPEQLEIVTLESAIYMSIKNDLAFLIDFNLYLFEHQSTPNRNMPLRFLEYVAAEYSRLTVADNLYGGRQIQIPAPHFIVFYNGLESYDERKVLKLSDLYQTREKAPELELRVQMLNINTGFNEDLKTQCRILGEYMQYVGKVRAYAKEMPIDMAVDKAVDECIRQSILRDFLLKNKAEVKHMSIYEYDEEATRRAMREYAYEQGMAEGEVKGIQKGIQKGNLEARRDSVLSLLEETGPIPENLQKKITEENDEEVLKNWLKLAGRAASIEEFMKKAATVKQ